MEKLEKDRLSDLQHEVYNAEDVIDGEYTVGMYGDKYKDVDAAYTKVLESLRELDKLLGEKLK